MVAKLSSAMTIFAHPDDMEFSCGATLAKWAGAGCEITVVLCTSGNVGTHDAQFTHESLTEARERARLLELVDKHLGPEVPRIIERSAHDDVKARLVALCEADDV